MNEELTKSDFQEAIHGIHVVIGDLSQKMVAGFVHVDEKFEQVDQRFEQVDRRFEQVDQRFEQVDQRFEQVDQRFEQVDQRFEQVDQRFEQVDQRFKEIDQRFTGVDKKFIGIDAQFKGINAQLKEAKEERQSMRADLSDLTIMTKVGFDDLSKKVDDNTKTIASVDTRIHRLTDIVYNQDLRLRLLEKS